MVINKDNSNTSRVKFISYDGSYPNLCRGVLTLEIDGVRYKFGHNYSCWELDSDYENGRFIDEDQDNPNYPSFWHSGGSCGFNRDYSKSHVEHGEWEIDAEEIDPKFKDVIDEIDTVFNDNVPYGCCGGCL